MAARLISALLISPVFLADTALAGWRGDSSKYKDAILLSNVESLTLRGHGALTSHRRVSAIPQLKCISHPDLCRHVNIDAMRCVNQGAGYDDQDIQWSCNAMLPDEFKLGSVNVICEGYANPDDPYILKGSCGAEYRAALTDRGEQRYPDLAGTIRSHESGKATTEFWFWVIFLSILGFIIWNAMGRYNENTGRRPPRTRPNGGGGGGYWGGGGGGGGGGPGGWDPRFDSNDNDAPPPYPGNKPYPSSSSSSWKPGFWSGAAAGSAGGYVAGRYANRNNRTVHNDYDNYGGYGYNGESSSSQAFRSRNSGSSGRSHQSTGFGSTSRR